MPDEVETFLRREESQRDRDELDDLVKASRPGGAQKRFQFGKRLLDRIEVGTIGRQKPQLRARAFDGDLDRGLFVHGQVIEHHDITRSERWHEYLLDVGEKGGRIDRPIKHRGCTESVDPQAGDHGMGLPMTEGRVVAETKPAWAATVAPQQIGRDAGFIEKHIPPRVAQWQPVLPAPPRRRDIRTSLFVGVYGFF